MYGVVTRNAPELEWDAFDVGFYEVKDVTGRTTDPVGTGISMVSCFGDNRTAGDQPDLVPVSETGERATRERTYFDWAYICPSDEEYKEALLDLVTEATDHSGDVRLDDVGFPREEYCHCERCREAFAESEYDDWLAWRASVITEFVERARERVDGRLFVTLYPDPYPGHLYERAGIDLDALSAVVDEFVVPLYDLDYGTTYWLEIIASGFEDALSVPFSIELYAVEVEVEDLAHATEVAAEYGNRVLFGYDASNARATLRRMRADAREGKRYEPSDG